MNSAQRIEVVLDSLSKESPNVSQSAQWERAFALGTFEADQREDLLVGHLQAFRAEISRVEVSLKSFGMEERLYAQHLQQLKSAASPRRMGEPWTSVSPHVVGAEVRLVVGWAAHFIPKAEGDIDPERLAELSALVADLTAAVEATNMPPVMARLVNEALASLRHALSLYKIAGIDPVREALHSSYGAITLAKDAVLQEVAAAPPEVQSNFKRFRSILKSVGEAADVVVKVKDGVAALGSISETVGPLIEMAKDIVK